MSIRNSKKAAAVLTAFLLVAGASVSVVLGSTPVFAQSAAEKSAVDGAKARGLVGEQGDGYLGFVTPSTDPGLASAVAAINNGRAAAYRDIGAKTKVSPEAAGQATAQELFTRLPAGQFFRPLNGNWTKK